MPIDLPATAIPVKEVLTRLTKAAEGPIKKRFLIHSAKKNIKNIYEHLRALGKVHTIWQTDRPTPIKKFYYPQELDFEDQKIVAKNLPDIAKISKKVVVQGIVGQGKSIFLRYLCIEELKKLSTIPVFLELRKFTKDKQLTEEIRDYLGDIGLDSSQSTFNYLMSNRKLAILLDAYDELDEEIEKKVYKEIERFCKKYPEILVVITSRPNYNIQNSEFFTISSIAPLRSEDLIPLLKKLCPDNESASDLNDGINRAGASVRGLLTTPLMVTLLVFVYKSDKKIPTKPIEFYESLFTTVLSRHDELKPGGVNRNRKVQISDTAFGKVFDCVSFLSSQDGKTSLKQRELISYIDDAKKYNKLELNADELLVEICKITCLILKDGFDFNYLHKSIQEYHAALFIADLPEVKAFEFYDSILNEHRWQKWQEQLKFLLELDRYRIKKRFILPICEAGMRKIFTPKKLVNAKLFSSLVDDISLGFNPASHDSLLPVRSMTRSLSAEYYYDIEESYVIQQFDIIVFNVLKGFEFSKKEVVSLWETRSREDVSEEDKDFNIELKRLLKKFGYKDKFLLDLSKALYAPFDKLISEASATINQMEDTADLFKF